MVMKTSTRFFLILGLAFALMVSACAADNDGSKKDDNAPTSSEKWEKSKVGALKIDPATQLPEDCTPGNAPNCSNLGPNDQLTCLPTGKCEFFTSDTSMVYADPFDPTATNTFTYIPCPGSGSVEDNQYCATQKLDVDNYVSACIVTEETAKAFPNAGRCAYFYKKCVVAEGTPCENSGSLTCDGGNCTCSVSAKMQNAGTEVCDGKDNDCDGSTDEQDAVGCTEYWVDSDGDSYGSEPSVAKCTCLQPEGWVTNHTDCNDSSASVHPKATEVCNGTDDNCDGVTDENTKVTYYADSDGDSYGNPNATVEACSAPQGYVADKTDCNDGNGSIHPNATEVCNEVDDNCDGSTDEWVQNTYYYDADGDGYGNVNATPNAACSAPQGYVGNNSDCNDDNANVHPGMSDVCNNVDDNCDGKTDEDYTNLGSGCGVGACANGTMVCSADGTKTVCSTAGNASTETCNNVDDNCDGKTDEDYTNLGSGCGVGACANGTMVCSKDGIKTVCSTAGNASTETCNNVDDNCDGQTDEGLLLTFYADADGDNHGDANMATQACSAPQGYVEDNTDCDDGDASIHPGAIDECNQVDDDCDGQTDYIKGVYQCDKSCPTVQKYACNQEFTLDFGANSASSTIASYNCWTAVGAKTIATQFGSGEFMLAPNVGSGIKYSFHILTYGTGALASLLHGTCSPNEGTNQVTAYNPAKGLNGTCATFSTFSVNGGTAGTDYVVLDKASATGKVTVMFVCTP